MCTENIGLRQALLLAHLLYLHSFIFQVSGLPIHNDNQHAAEIATMSLHLLSEVKNFTIRHRPKEKLMLRIGIHSGMHLCYTIFYFVLQRPAVT